MVGGSFWPPNTFLAGSFIRAWSLMAASAREVGRGLGRAPEPSAGQQSRAANKVSRSIGGPHFLRNWSRETTFGSVILRGAFGLFSSAGGSGWFSIRRRRALAAPPRGACARRRRLELQAELHGGIEEALHGIEGDDQLFRHVVEGELHLEAVVLDMQVPVLVLQHDGHLARVALRDLLGQLARPGASC